MYVCGYVATFCVPGCACNACCYVVIENITAGEAKALAKSLKTNNTLGTLSLSCKRLSKMCRVAASVQDISRVCVRLCVFVWALVCLLVIASGSIQTLCYQLCIIVARCI